MITLPGALLRPVYLWSAIFRRDALGRMIDCLRIFPFKQLIELRNETGRVGEPVRFDDSKGVERLVTRERMERLRAPRDEVLGGIALVLDRPRLMKAYEQLANELHGKLVGSPKEPGM